jgi:FkbM family methyltransferase
MTLMWNDKEDPIEDVSEAFSQSLGWDVCFRCPKHLIGGAFEVLAGEYDPKLPMIDPTWAPRVLDIGANIGAFGAWVRHKWPAALVESFEPNPRAFEVLEQNRELAKAGDLWTIYPSAINAMSGRRVLYPGRGNLGQASFHHDVGGTQEEGGVEVTMQDAETLPDAQVIKVDTEGCEVAILDRYLSTHATAPTLVMLEFHRTIDRFILEELLAWYGLALIRGFLLSPVRGTLIFARVREHPTITTREVGDLYEVGERFAHLANLVGKGPL